MLPITPGTAGQQVNRTRRQFHNSGPPVMNFSCAESHAASGTEGYARDNSEMGCIPMPADPGTRKVFRNQGFRELISVDASELCGALPDLEECDRNRRALSEPVGLEGVPPTKLGHTAFRRDTMHAYFAERNRPDEFDQRGFLLRREEVRLQQKAFG